MILTIDYFFAFGEGAPERIFHVDYSKTLIFHPQSECSSLIQFRSTDLHHTYTSVVKNTSILICFYIENEARVKGDQVIKKLPLDFTAIASIKNLIKNQYYS